MALTIKKKKIAAAPILRIPFHRQRNGYYCGPATLQMVGAWRGIRHSQAWWARQLATDRRNGSSVGKMVRACKTLGLRVDAGSRRRISDIRAALRAGHPVIVLYTEPSADEGHYAIVLGIRNGSLILHDPWNGPKFHIPQSEFTRRWHSTLSHTRRWMAVLQP